mmetsp:Transcript_24900/g.59951  ORF Transcript_24900/g.59951 Transcript_24900/m.59951 type:complete len:125 (-) Transcript_24900:241-615(-)
MQSDITSMKSDISAIKSLLEEESRQKTLERAIQHVAFKSFPCYRYGNDMRVMSNEYAKTALKQFMFHRGYTIPEGLLLLANCSPSEAEKMAFRDKFIEYIGILTKRKPRQVKKYGDGKITIYYQ